MRLSLPSFKSDYTLLASYGQVASSSKVARYLKIALVLAIIIALLIALHPISVAQKYGLIPHYEPIPNIVHYVYIKKDSTSEINFHFAHFLSLYAAITHVGASKVYVHSDYNDTEIAEAAAKGSNWTRKVLSSFPDIVKWNAVHAPEFAGTSQKTPIKNIEHKSDFLRWETIMPIGGVYMDWDVVALRPLEPLMTSGFAFVAGRQMHNDPKDADGSKGEMNNGIFMTRPNSLMARIMYNEQNSNFAGEWSDNIKFMTSVAERLVAIPGEVLICDRNAFAPTNWYTDTKDMLFVPHGGLASPEPISTNSTDPVEIYDTLIMNRRNRREWEWDLSSTYTLHAFGQSKYNHHITPKTILARTSNYGVAVWGIVKKMVAEGVITGMEDTW